MIRSIILTSILFTTPAVADVEVSFRDGAPKDQFTISNTGSCALSGVSVRIDLRPSPAGLIFDVTAQGSGVEVFQPFEVVEGADLIVAASPLEDGDQILQVDLSSLPSASTVQFTTDLDDTIGAREITVSGAEIQGALVGVAMGADLFEGIFDDTGRAVVSLADCVS